MFHSLFTDVRRIFTEASRAFSNKLFELDIFADFLLQMGPNKTGTLTSQLTMFGDFSLTTTFSTMGELAMPGTGSMTLLSSHIGFHCRVYISKIDGTIHGEVGSGSGVFEVQTAGTVNYADGDRHEVTFSYELATNTYTLMVDSIVVDTTVNAGSYSPFISFVGSNAVGGSDFEGILYSVEIVTPAETRSWFMTSGSLLYEPSQQDPDDRSLDLTYNNIVASDWYTVSNIITHNFQIVFHNNEIVTEV